MRRAVRLSAVQLLVPHQYQYTKGSSPLQANAPPRPAGRPKRGNGAKRKRCGCGGGGRGGERTVNVLRERGGADREEVGHARFCSSPDHGQDPPRIFDFRRETR